MNWKQVLIDAGLPCEWAEMRDGRVEAGFSRPLTFAENVKFLELTDLPAARRAGAIGEAALVAELKNVTGNQAADWIETNVTSLATAKTALKILARMVIAMRNEVWPDLPDKQ